MDRKAALKDFGDMIRSAREKAGMTQLALGFELGFQNGQFISNLERGMRALPPKHVAKLSRTLSLQESIVIEHLLNIRKAMILERRIAC
jgi:transcriptional regulator with XRE-family HTH domain